MPDAFPAIDASWLDNTSLKTGVAICRNDCEIEIKFLENGAKLVTSDLIHDQSKSKRAVVCSA
jgi:hypothetical protein